MIAKKSSQVTEPGAYQWIDRSGTRHVGYVSRDRSGELIGAFVSKQGNSRATSFHADDETGNGSFYGPFELPT